MSRIQIDCANCGQAVEKSWDELCATCAKSATEADRRSWRRRRFFAHIFWAAFIVSSPVVAYFSLGRPPFPRFAPVPLLSFAWILFTKTSSFLFGVFVPLLIGERLS